MAVKVGEDEYGPYATVECDRRGCARHVSIRPVGDDWSGYDMACTVFDMAEDEGWRLVGRTYCPQDALERPQRRPRVGDGYGWAEVHAEAVKGGQRPA